MLFQEKKAQSIKLRPQVKSGKTRIEVGIYVEVGGIYRMYSLASRMCPK